MGEFYRCGRAVVRHTSWSDLNPGRRYEAGNLFRQNGGCQYFAWIDPPACERCNQIIPELLRNMNSKDEQLKELKKNVDELKKIVGGLKKRKS